VAEDCETGVSLIAVLPDGEKIILLAGNANGAWSEAAADAATAAVAEAPPGSVLVTDAEVPAEVVACCIEAARRRRLPVVLDPSPAGQVAKKLLVGVAAITPNPKEAEALTGIAVDGFDAAHQAAIILRTLGVPLACVKLGGGGCVAAWEGGVVGVPRVPVPTVDSTGAGDAFAGALGVALLEGRPPREAACLAVATAGLAVTTWGSQPAYPSRADAERLMPGLLAATHDLLAV
jgi:ribokinase